MFTKIKRFLNNDKKNNRYEGINLSSSKVFQTDNPIYFMNERGGFGGRTYEPMYSYHDFNENADVLSDLLKPGSDSRYYLEFAKNKTGLPNVLCEAKLRFDKITDDKAYFQFGTVANHNYRQNNKHYGAMTYLVGTLIYIILNDKYFENIDIIFSLDMQLEAKEVYMQGVDVYYHIFNSEKNITNPELEGLHREKVFSARNRMSDIEYFRGLLIEKENTLLSMNTSGIWKNR